jgi:hypothetical protein
MTAYHDHSVRALNISYPVALLLTVIVLFASSCGKKSAPSLAAYEKPPAPVLLRAVHRDDRIILSWSFPQAKTASISGFTILRSSGNGLKRITVPGSRRSFAETAFTCDTSYTFRIVAKSTAGVLSDDSNKLTLTPLVPPSPPTHLSFKIEYDSVILSWESAGEDILYNVYRRFGKEKYGGKALNASPLSQNSFKDVFRINTPVYYSIRSLRNRTMEDEGPPSQEIAVLPSDLVPPAPMDLQFFAAPGKVFLYWKAPPERWITGYRIYRKTEGHAYRLIGETPVPTFLDTDGASAERDYRVNAVGPSREGPGTEIRGVIFRHNVLH